MGKIVRMAQATYITLAETWKRDPIVMPERSMEMQFMEQFKKQGAACVQFFDAEEIKDSEGRTYSPYFNQTPTIFFGRRIEIVGKDNEPVLEVLRLQGFSAICRSDNGKNFMMRTGDITFDEYVEQIKRASKSFSEDDDPFLVSLTIAAERITEKRKELEWIIEFGLNKGICCGLDLALKMIRDVKQEHIDEKQQGGKGAK